MAKRKRAAASKKTRRKRKPASPAADVSSYDHPDASSLARPEVGAQAHFKKTKAPATYRYDSSLAPELNWDGQNPAREEGEALIRAIEDASSLEEAKTAAARLKAMSRPFLNWSGKAERLSFDVPTLPLFIHERLSTRAILETVKTHQRDKQIGMFDELFGVAERDLTDQVLRAYEYADNWVNRLVLGDSLVVMSSLLHYENLGGQVQMIYIDPPYGVKFGSNFQPFVRKRDVKHNEDDDLTREPEMVQAYRDTWELGLHSYLAHLQDRLVLARDLLHPSGSVFVQISDDNLHHVRELLDEVFGPENGVVTIVLVKKGNQKSEFVDPINDYICWYAKDKDRARKVFQPLFKKRELDESTLDEFNYVELKDRRIFTLTELSSLSEDGVDYTSNPRRLQVDFPEARLFDSKDLTVGGVRKNQSVLFPHDGRDFDPGLARGLCWKHTARTEDGSISGMQRLANLGRLFVAKDTLRFKRYLEDFPYIQISNIWADLGGAKNRVYVVQTNPEAIKRCMLMTTQPGDLVVDPTCGSGTTAYVAEQWGRRWITCDTSRVPLALARQRLLTAVFDYYELKNELRGPAGGFVYKSGDDSRNPRSTGPGIVSHITSSTLANEDLAAPEVLVDRAEVVRGVSRVTGPFTFEATIAAAEGLDKEPDIPGIQSEQHQSHVARMIEVLKRAPVIRLSGNETLTLKQIRPPAKTLALSAEALIDAPTLANAIDDVSSQPGLVRDQEPIAILFGPENGPISERLVREAWDEAGLKHYKRLFVIGFGIDPKAREFIEKAGRIGIPAVYLQATMDLQMGDLLKNMRSSQVFSVCGLPDVTLRHSKDNTWQVELVGLDTFDPATMDAQALKGEEVPAWFLDTDYNGLVFRVRQAFFPRTGAWENLKRALRYEFEDSVWEHLSGTTSAPFTAGDHAQIAVKVIDPRGNELVVVKVLDTKR